MTGMSNVTKKIISKIRAPKGKCILFKKTTKKKAISCSKLILKVHYHS